jgi:hypothetical protein
MYSNKRVSVSPSSLADLKSLFSVYATENLQCLICQELVVDAVQVICCGALHCRACISKCDKCPQCRKHVNADCIVPDVRCERLTAACSRPCPNAQHGCDFNGNRASVTAHEDICEFVPRSILRGKIQAAQLEIRQQETLLETLLARLSLQRQHTQADERTKLQTAMMRCALGNDPAKAALRVLYSLPEDIFISEVDREKARGKRHRVVLFYHRQVSLAVHESNHNVAVWFCKSSHFTPKAPGTNVRFVLLHPYDTALSKKVVFDVSVLNDVETGSSIGFPNFMTSEELDDHTVNRKYYITVHSLDIA